MTARILLDGDGAFRVCKPGFDVRTAGPLDLLFEANGGAYSGLYTFGFIQPLSFPQISTVQTARNGLTRTYELVSALGKTFSSPPKLTLYGYRPDINLTSRGYNEGIYGIDSASNTGFGDNRALTGYCTTTQIFLRYRTIIFDRGNFTLDPSLAYFQVFQT
jgi:hypothetical protein